VEWCFVGSGPLAEPITYSEFPCERPPESRVRRVGDHQDRTWFPALWTAVSPVWLWEKLVWLIKVKVKVKIQRWRSRHNRWSNLAEPRDSTALHPSDSVEVWERTDCSMWVSGGCAVQWITSYGRGNLRNRKYGSGCFSTQQNHFGRQTWRWIRKPRSVSTRRHRHFPCIGNEC